MSHHSDAQAERREAGPQGILDACLISLIYEES